LETIRLEGDDAVPVVLDVAHNPDGMSALINGLVEAFVFDRAVVVLGILADKDYRGMLSELSRIPCTLVLTQPKSVRSVAVEDLKSAAEETGLEAQVQDDVGDAVKTALTAARPGELVCITGSHYVVGEARTQLTH
jgi:dihydrofolate synthase/folylpolyglutamate synthase